jgi:hypothetical protein
MPPRWELRRHLTVIPGQRGNGRLWSDLLASNGRRVVPVRKTERVVTALRRNDVSDDERGGDRPGNNNQ